MYCRACGKEIVNNSSVCMSCGVPVGKGKRFCPMCGAKSDEEAVYCVKCGIGFTPVQQQAPKNAKSRVAAGVMGFFVGFLGVHNFYLGYTVKAIFQLVLGLAWLWMIFIGALIGGSAACILLGMLMSLASAIWAFIEVILLLCGVKNTDGKGNQLKD